MMLSPPPTRQPVSMHTRTVLWASGRARARSRYLCSAATEVSRRDGRWSLSESVVIGTTTVTADLFQRRRHLGASQLAEVLAVDGHHRTERASPQTGDSLERVLQVVARRAGLDAELVFDRAQDAVPSADVACGPLTDADLVPPARHGRELSVERDHAVGARGGQARETCDLGDDLIGQVAEVALGSLEDGDEAVSYTHLRAHETRHDLVCRLLLEKKK